MIPVSTPGFEVTKNEHTMNANESSTMPGKKNKNQIKMKLEYLKNVAFTISAQMMEAVNSTHR